MSVAAQVLPSGLLGEPRVRVRALLGLSAAWQEWCGIDIADPEPGEVEAAAMGFVGFGALPPVPADVPVRAVVELVQPFTAVRHGGALRVAPSVARVVVMSPLELILADWEAPEDPDGPPEEPTAAESRWGAQDAEVYREADAETIFCNRLAAVILDLFEVEGTQGFIREVRLAESGVTGVLTEGGRRGRHVGAVLEVEFGLT